MTRASDNPTKTRPSPSATPSRSGVPILGAAGEAAPRAPPVVANRQTVFPVLASIFSTFGGAVKYIMPFFTTVMAREFAGGVSRSDIQAPPSRDTFWRVIWSRVEYRLPRSPMTVDHPRPVDGCGPDWTKSVAGRATTAARAAAGIHSRYRPTPRRQELESVTVPASSVQARSLGLEGSDAFASLEPRYASLDDGLGYSKLDIKLPRAVSRAVLVMVRW